MSSSLPLLMQRACLRSLAGILMACGVATAEDAAQSIRRTVTAEIEAAKSAAEEQKKELARKYAAALDALEKKLAAEGNLDAILHLREERDAVTKTGQTTSHADAPLAELRKKYEGALEGIEKKFKGTRAEAVAGIAVKARARESELTKAGKIEEALALRKQADALILEFGGGDAAAEIPFQEDPRADGTAEPGPLAAIEIPKDTPPAWPEPFAQKDRWLESLTVPARKQRIRSAIVIGDRAKKSWPLIVVSPGSTWSATDQGRVELSAGKFVAAKCRFEKLPLQADLACDFYFTNCAFEDCRFEKGGVWYGSELAGKFYMDRCIIRKNFSNPINVVDTGFRIQDSVFEDIELPPMSFRKKQPADYVNQRWLRIVRCRFVKCTIPASFLLLTRDCVFEECVFTDDEQAAEPVTKAIEIDLYVKNSKSRLKDLPGKVILNERPDTQLKVEVPTLSALEREIDP